MSRLSPACFLPIPAVEECDGAIGSRLARVDVVPKFQV